MDMTGTLGVDTWNIWQSLCLSRPSSSECFLTSRRHSNVDDGSTFAAIGHFTEENYLYIAMPVSAHLDGQALLDLDNLHRLRKLFVHSLRVKGDNGANASIHAEVWQLISLFDSCKTLSGVYLDVELVISGEAPQEVEKVDAIVEILDNGSWGASVIRHPPSSDAEALPQWSPPSAESDIMLGINSNFVPGGNQTKLNQVTVLED